MSTGSDVWLLLVCWSVGGNTWDTDTHTYMHTLTHSQLHTHTRWSLTSSVFVFSFVVMVMKRSRVLSLLVGGVFCVALMSLYRMLELMQGAELQQSGKSPVVQVDEVSDRNSLMTLHRYENWSPWSCQSNCLFTPTGVWSVSTCVIGRQVLCEFLVSVFKESIKTLCRNCPASSRRLTGWSISLGTTTVWLPHCGILWYPATHHGKKKEKEPTWAQSLPTAGPTSCLAADLPERWRMELMAFRLA